MRSELVTVPYDGIFKFFTSDDRGKVVDVSFVEDEEWVDNRGPRCWHLLSAEKLARFTHFTDGRIVIGDAVLEKVHERVAFCGFADIKSMTLELLEARE